MCFDLIEELKENIILRIFLLGDFVVNGSWWID